MHLIVRVVTREPRGGFDFAVVHLTPQFLDTLNHARVQRETCLIDPTPYVPVIWGSYARGSIPETYKSLTDDTPYVFVHGVPADWKQRLRTTNISNPRNADVFVTSRRLVLFRCASYGHTTKGIETELIPLEEFFEDHSGQLEWQNLQAVAKG